MQVWHSREFLFSVSNQFSSNCYFQRRDSKDESYIHVFTLGFLSTFDLEQGAKLHRYY